MHNLYPEISSSVHMWPLFPCYEGPNKKGVKSRKGLSWDFWQGFVFSLELVHFPMHAKNKAREVQLCWRDLILRNLWLIRHPNKHWSMTLKKPNALASTLSEVYWWNSLCDRYNKSSTSMLHIGMSPSSGVQAVHVSSPPGRSSAGEYQASITNEKAPCGDRWGKKTSQKKLKNFIKGIFSLLS